MEALVVAQSLAILILTILWQRAERRAEQASKPTTVPKYAVQGERFRASLRIVK